RCAVKPVAIGVATGHVRNCPAGGGGAASVRRGGLCGREPIFKICHTNEFFGIAPATEPAAHGGCRPTHARRVCEGGNRRLQRAGEKKYSGQQWVTFPPLPLARIPGCCTPASEYS